MRLSRRFLFRFLFEIRKGSGEWGQIPEYTIIQIKKAKQKTAKYQTFSTSRALAKQAAQKHPLNTKISPDSIEGYLYVVNILIMIRGAGTVVQGC